MKVFAATLAALAFPATAWGEATLVTRELPVAGQRTLAAAPAPERFNLVGLHWKGPGRVLVRTRGPARWSAWREVEAEPEELPDRGTDESRRMRGWRLGAPLWIGESSRLQVRVRGRVSRLRAHYVWSPEEREPLGRSLQMAGSPPIVSRKAWGANEAIRRDNPVIARTLTTAIVHHTAGAEPATPAQSAAIVRGVYLYHVRGNGWDDLGYNFLVDRFGQVFEGRYGGIERNVVGAHSQGFNTGSVGIALLGNYASRSPSQAARAALVRLLAWRLDVAHVDPRSSAPVVSAGNPKYRKGVPLFLRAVSGHRDTGFTTCPGRLYKDLRTIASSAAGLGLPKLYIPEVEGGLGQFVSFSGRLSTALPWTVTITDTNGKQVAQGSGFGTNVQWTWDSRFATLPGYRWRMAAGPNVRPASGTLGAAGRPAVISGVTAEPAGFTPNGDGRTDTTAISYELGGTGTVRIDLQNEQGVPLATLQSGSRPAGRHVFTWNGAGQPDGRYRIAVVARVAGREVTATTDVVLSRTLSGFGIVPAAISPNGDGRSDSLTASFNLAAPAFARLAVRRGTTDVVTVFDALAAVGPQAIAWPGGVRDGVYSVALTVTDAAGPVTQLLPVRVDRIAPKLRVVNKRPLRVSLSEPARVTFVADGVASTVFRRKAGVFTVVLGRPFKSLVAFAEDQAANVGPRLRLR
ncbi:MAG TPA: N-acetylmuramoyl-L-alanine amidase [Gaiellaceae bacterium]|nr:N-acetylmuramoyl-L-alanine amidase [Gaiellaceae bacterium]